MYSFSINARPTTSANSADKAVSANYVTRLDGVDSFIGSVTQDSGHVRASRIDSMCDQFGDFEMIQLNRAGIRRIEVRESANQRPIGDIYGNKIQANSEKVIIAEMGGTSGDGRKRGKRKMFSFRRERDDTEVGWIETAYSARQCSKINRLLSAFKKSDEPQCKVWDGQLVFEVVDFRMILAASILLDIDR